MKKPSRDFWIDPSRVDEARAVRIADGLIAAGFCIEDVIDGFLVVMIRMQKGEST